MKFIIVISFFSFVAGFIYLSCAGNLCNENNDTSNGSYFTPNNKRKIENDKGNGGAPAQNNNGHRSDDVTTTAAAATAATTTIDSCTLSTETAQLMNVSRIDRNKFCGSLPNHLDADDVCEENRKSKLSCTNINTHPFKYIVRLLSQEICCIFCFVVLLIDDITDTFFSRTSYCLFEVFMQKKVEWMVPYCVQ